MMLVGIVHFSSGECSFLKERCWWNPTSLCRDEKREEREKTVDDARWNCSLLLGGVLFSQRVLLVEFFLLRRERIVDDARWELSACPRGSGLYSKSVVGGILGSLMMLVGIVPLLLGGAVFSQRALLRNLLLGYEDR